MGSLRVLLACGLVACAARGDHRYGRATAVAASTLTARELDQSPSRDLYEAIERLRPKFLRRNARGETPTVVVNGVPAGADALRQLTSADVAEVRLLHGPEAAALYGVVTDGPVIVVTIRSRR
jgi:hypothetical protein